MRNGVDADARAVHFDGETSRTLPSLGVTSKFQEVTIPMRNLEIVGEARDVLVHAHADRLGDKGWNDNATFRQPDLERPVREIPSITRLSTIHP